MITKKQAVVQPVEYDYIFTFSRQELADLDRDLDTLCAYSTTAHLTTSIMRMRIKEYLDES